MTTEPNLKAITGKYGMLLSYVLACCCLIRSFLGLHEKADFPVGGEV